MTDQFTKSGWLHRRIKREGMIAIYERSRLPGGTLTHYEVVRIQRHGAREITDAATGEVTRLPAGEHYPSSEQWGAHGLTLRDRREAEDMFCEWTAKEAAKESEGMLGV